MYNHLPAYPVPMPPPLTPCPDRTMEPAAAAEAMLTQWFGVLCMTLMGLVDPMVPNSGPSWADPYPMLLSGGHPMVGVTLWPSGPPHLSHLMPLLMPGFLTAGASNGNRGDFEKKGRMESLPGLPKL
ncbi:hypothetical protein DSO57_1020836 [Entomophthora muscae]|uniref:Uncharacterized protein n=1 Tax=Entomophthora muscae TaxID=34485 RepID=A0ACC2UCG7_9FUNG|nr:hypothetical protein DSO57_1020836 [Entomophthora muscae]